MARTRAQDRYDSHVLFPMRRMMRARLATFATVAVLGIGGAFALADSVNLVSPRTVEPHGEVFPPHDGATAEAAAPEHDELGASASSGKAERRGDRDKRRSGSIEAGGEQVVMAAAVIPANSDGSGPPSPCSGTDSCVDRVGRLITDVADKLPGLPKIRECESSIGGEAICFHFGAGNYLVGDSPVDGEAELGFCTDDGYYYVSGPSLGGGTGGACPDDRPADGGAGGDAPIAQECTSSIGGEATCFDFGGGNYLVSDPLADGEGELGFCTSSDYYYVSAPSAEGDAGVKCPSARLAR
jgi:hypothetical protein